MRTAQPSWKVLVLTCANSRPPGGKPSCGAESGAALRNALRDRARAEGLRDLVIVSRTGCLGVCAADGSTVVVVTASGGRQVLVVPAGAPLEPLWSIVVRAALEESVPGSRL